MLLLRTVFYGVIICLSWGGLLWAAETDEAIESIPEITVVDQAVVNTPGKSVLDRNALQALPQGDGAITDLLRVLPGVQFSEADNSSLTGGEILPPEISISGGRIYDNNFMIDGLGNNSLLDPTYSKSDNAMRLPGHSQELFMDTSLIDTISIYRSNISARYSGFTGGVVDIETIDPSGEFGGEISIRTTRSEWTSFHLDRDDREAFEQSEEPDYQPEFRKYYGSAMLDLPLTETMGLLMSYSRAESKIPLWYFGEKKSQYRTLENYFVKYIYQPSERTAFRLTFLSSPYEGEYFRDDVKDSDFSLDGGGWSVSAKLEHQFSFASAEFIAGWRESENSRRAPQNYYNYLVTPSADWGDKYSRLGGYGDVDTEQQSVTLASHFEFSPLTLTGVEHQWNSGITLERTLADYQRTETSNSGWKASDSVICDEGDNLCIAGEQYAYSQVIYPEDTADAEITFVDAYVEDVMTWQRLTFRPGVHLSYNDFTKSTDYAARGSLAYDLFGNGYTVLTVGANRYYGKTLLTHALDAEKELTSLWKRSLNDDNTLSPWVESVRKSFAVTRVSDLETPHVDEWSVGLEQELLGGDLTLSYIDRNGENLLTKRLTDKDDFGYSYTEWTNLGNNRHKEVSMTWEREWERHYLLVSGTWQRSFSSNEDYDDFLDLDDLEELVWYEDQMKLITDLPRTDFNREWSFNLVYRVELDYGLSFSNTTRYRSGYEGITDTGDNYVLEDGTKVDIYAKRDYPSATVFDWKLEWEYPLNDAQNLTVTADVYNVFNRKVYSGIEGQYQMGRQLWVGMEYAF